MYLQSWGLEPSARLSAIKSWWFTISIMSSEPCLRSDNTCLLCSLDVDTIREAFRVHLNVHLDRISGPYMYGVQT